MKARETGATQVDAAALAQISRRSGQRIETGSDRPNRGRARNWRTTPNPLAEVWESELEPMLRREPRLKPTTLFEYLQERYPGQYPRVLRTVQRRVSAWKAVHGPAPEVMFELRHEPGMIGLSDFTELKGVEVTINGVPFEHLIYHYRLAYSGCLGRHSLAPQSDAGSYRWQYAQVIQGGESFIALSEGLQNALNASGGAPKQHRTDSLSAAYRNARGQHRKQLTDYYQELCDHYRLEPTRNNKGIAHENGSIESPHGHLKNRITQALYLHGQTNFESIAAYQAFIEAAVAKLNAQHPEKFAEEQQYLRPLPKYRACDYEILTARVSRYSTIDVRCVLYTVPSRLIGRQLELRLYHDRITGYIGNQQVVELPRVRASSQGKRRAKCINYRHVIEGLRRKPRAFLYCTWRDELLPNDHYRRLWQQIKERFELDSAAVLIVEALYIAATQDKALAVANYLDEQLIDGRLTLVGLRRHFQLLTGTQMPTVSVKQHDLSSYDQLLSPERLVEPLKERSHRIPDTDSFTKPSQQSVPKSQRSSQAAAPLAHAQSLGRLAASSDAGAVVVRPVLAGTLRIGGGEKMAAVVEADFEGSSLPWLQDAIKLRLVSYS